MTSLIQNLGWTDLKKRRKNARLVSMFKIWNELVEIPSNDRLIPADRRTRGGHNQAYRHLRKWNESSFRPPLCTYRLNWARRTSWWWWDDWDDTVLQTQDSKFEPWRSEAEHATSRSRRLPTILTFTRGWGRNNFISFKPPRPETEPRTLAWKAAVLTTTLGPPPYRHLRANTTLGQNSFWHRTIPDWNFLLWQRSRVTWLNKSTSPFPLQPDTPNRRCCWSTNSKFKFTRPPVVHWPSTAYFRDSPSDGPWDDSPAPSSGDRPPFTLSIQDFAVISFWHDTHLFDVVDPLNDASLLKLARKLGEEWPSLADPLQVQQEDLEVLIANVGTNYSGGFRMLWNWRDSLGRSNNDESGIMKLTNALSSAGFTELANEFQRMRASDDWSENCPHLCGWLEWWWLKWKPSASLWIARVVIVDAY